MKKSWTRLKKYGNVVVTNDEVNPNERENKMTAKTNTVAVNASDVLAEVAKFTEDNSRPCPSKYLAEKFGDEVIETLAALKEEGVLLGLRGRNGGFALPGSDIVAKRSEHAVKKALKAAAAAAEDTQDEAAVG